MSTEAQKYNRNNPYQSTMLVNTILTDQDSEKETRHIEMELEAGMEYLPGDALGILPANRASEVEAVLKALNFKGEERVLDHYKNEISLFEALEKHLTIGKLTRSALLQYIKIAPETTKGLDDLKGMVGPENKSKAEEYVWGRELIDLITEHPGGITEPQQLFQVVGRLVPRLYSIASSQQKAGGNVHTTVRVVKYHSHNKDRQGVCSGQLGERAPEGTKLPVFLHGNNNFRLPEDTDTPVIMIGPGTGIAPFRAFLQHRHEHGHKGKNWLFFGDQRKSSDFLYQQELEAWEQDGFLKLHTAFSRDQSHKIYVQDRMRENSEELYKWLADGAHFYVCGDATRMAKDVETALLDAIANGTNTSPEHAQEYLKEMKKAKRYQLDVY